MSFVSLHFLQLNHTCSSLGFVPAATGILLCRSSLSPLSLPVTLGIICFSWTPAFLSFFLLFRFSSPPSCLLSPFSLHFSPDILLNRCFDEVGLFLNDSTILSNVLPCSFICLHLLNASTNHEKMLVCFLQFSKKSSLLSFSHPDPSHLHSHCYSSSLLPLLLLLYLLLLADWSSFLGALWLSVFFVSGSFPASVVSFLSVRGDCPLYVRWWKLLVIFLGSLWLNHSRNGGSSVIHKIGVITSKVMLFGVTTAASCNLLGAKDAGAASFEVGSDIASICLAPVGPVDALLKLTLIKCCLDSSLLRCMKWTPSARCTGFRLARRLFSWDIPLFSKAFVLNIPSHVPLTCTFPLSQIT